MKKAIALAMASVMAAGLLAGCGGSAANSTAASSEAASLKNTPTSPLSALTARGTAGRKLSPLPWLPAPLPT